MIWHKIVLSQRDINDGEMVAISCRMVDVLVRTSARDLALFRRISDGTPFTSMTYYVPPSAVHYCPEFLEHYNAEPCERPKSEGVVVEAGDTSLVSLLSS